jgi:hypothetical protein
MLDIQSPLIDEIVTRARCEGTRKSILRVLTARLGPAPPDIAAGLQSIDDETRLDGLVDWASQCPDLDAFRTRLLS